MSVVIFGSSGATGRELVGQALVQGHHVTAFVRNPSRLGPQSSETRVVRGDVSDRLAVARAIEGQNGVLCALGAATPLRRDPALIEGVRHIVEAMERLGVRRLVYLSFLGVPEGRRQLSAIGRFVVAPVILRNVVADHEEKERIIRQSRLDWVIVRPPRLTHGARRGDYRAGVEIRAFSAIPQISRADLADFMLAQLNDDTYLRKTPAVMY
jgi:putative NADH-flavin reductase